MAPNTSSSERDRKHTYSFRPVPLRNPRAADRLRAVVHKVVELRRRSGVDIRIRHGQNEQFFKRIHARCSIQVVDYSPSFADATWIMGNLEFVKWAENKKTSKRPAWAGVRWINVAGISYDVVNALGLKYDMHPLAVSELLLQRAQARSKAETYADHLHLRVLTHVLRESSRQKPFQEPQPPTNIGYAPREQELKGASADDVTLMGARTFNSLISEGAAETAASSGKSRVTDRVGVHLAMLDIFAYPDGTLITFHAGTDQPDRLARPDLKFTAPILARILQHNSELRQTGDASLLLQSLLDLIVDRTIGVADGYRERIHYLERVVLQAPSLSLLQALHTLSGDLILHMRTMSPIRTLMAGLQQQKASKWAKAKALSPRDAFAFSPLANFYLADVQEHIEYTLENLELYAAKTDNLINYTFNAASYNMNRDMRSLTLVTAIFFPLTLLTGYFGMNFESMWSVNQNTDLLFWEIAIPVLLFCIPLFLWQDITLLAHRIQRRVFESRTRKERNKDMENFNS